MSACPLQRSSFVDGAYGAIKQRILSGELAPGTPLNIEALRREMGISNSPIREALRRLENEQWVQTVPFRGAFVRSCDAAELAELYELREMLELAALGKVMPEPDPEQVKRLGEILAEIQETLARQDAAAYFEADVRFHQAIVDMAGNRRLSQTYTRLIEQGQCFMLGRRLEGADKCRRDRDEHRQLFEAIRQGQTDRARDLLRSHLRSACEETPNVRV